MPTLAPSKIERWQRAHSIRGVPIPAKNLAPTLGYKAQQWGVGPSGSGRLGRKGRWYAERADRLRGGKHWKKKPA